MITHNKFLQAMIHWIKKNNDYPIHTKLINSLFKKLH